MRFYLVPIFQFENNKRTCLYLVLPSAETKKIAYFAYKLLKTIISAQIRVKDNKYFVQNAIMLEYDYFLKNKP